MEATIGASLPPVGSMVVACINPDHPDDEPSMSVSAEGLFYCHGCGVKGDALKAVAVVHDLDITTQFRVVLSKAWDLAAQDPGLTRPTRTEGRERSGTNGALPEPIAMSQRIKLQAQAARYLVRDRQLHDPWVTGGLELEYAVRAGKPEVVFVGRSFVEPARRVRIARSLDPDAPKSARYRVLGKDATSVLVQFCDPPAEMDCIVITEGVIDALTALDADFFAVSLPSGARNVNKLATALDAAARAFDTIIIALDGDEAGHAGAEALAASLYGSGARQIRRVRYPNGMKDLNEVLVASGPDAVHELLDEAPLFLPRTAPASWLDAPEALLAEELPREFLVGDLIQEGDAVLVAGRGDTGKSMLTLDLAVALASGTGATFGHHPVHRDCHVVVVNEEMHAADLRTRARRLAKGRGISPEVISRRLRLGHSSGITLTGPGFERLVQLCREEPRLVVIIDSLRPLLGDVPEVDNIATLKALRRLDPLRQGPGRHTFIILAHEAKGISSRAEWQTLAGSGASFNWADVVLRVVRKDRQPRSLLKMTKGRARKHGSENREFEVEDTSNGGLVLKWHDPPARTGSKGEFSESEVLGVLRSASGPMLRKAILRQLSGNGEAERGGYARLEPVLARLVEKGVVRCDGSDSHPVYSPIPGPESTPTPLS